MRSAGFTIFHSTRGFCKTRAQAAVLAQFIDYVKTKNVWFANFGAAADWSSRWMLVDVDSMNAGKSRSNLIVTSNSPGKFASLRLHAYLPDDVTSLTATPEKLGGHIRIVTEKPGEAILEIPDVGANSLVFYVERHS